MIPLFLGLTAANLIVLSLAFGLGLLVPEAGGGVSKWHAYHIGIGIAAGLLTTLVHVAVYTYFMATTKWLAAATDKSAQDESVWVEGARRRKSRVFPVSMAAIGATVLAMVAGAAADPTVRPWISGEVHMAVAAGALVINGLCALIQFRLIRSQGTLMDDALHTLNNPNSSTQPTQAVATAILILLGFSVLPACAESVHATGVATQPAATQPTVPMPQGHAAVSLDEWLDRIEAQAATVKTFRADIRYDRIQGLVGDRQRRFGTLYYEAGPPARFAVHFDRLLVDRRLDHQDRSYIFDGVWMVERHDDEKLFIKRQVSEELDDLEAGGAAGGGDPLSLGQGPFPVPVTFKKSQVLERYDVTLVDENPKSYPNTVELELVPKAGTGSSLTRVRLWYDRETLFPRSVHTYDESENESVIHLTEAVTNTPIEPGVLNTLPPTDPAWRVEIKPLGD